MATNAIQTIDADLQPNLDSTNTSSLQSFVVPQNDFAGEAPSDSDEDEEDEDDEEDVEDEEDEEELDPEVVRLMQEKILLGNLLFHNVKNASYRDEPKSDAEFTKFPKLAPELRVLVWRFASMIPRIVEVEEVSSDTTRENYTQWRCKNRLLPPLLSTCRESRAEALKEYTSQEEQDTEEIMLNPNSPLRFRYDWDILHLKNFNFSYGEKDFVQSGFHSTGHWQNEPSYLRPVGTDPFDHEMLERCSMRHFFKNVKALAINRETYASSMLEASWILQYYFPNLVLLVVLIDDDVDIESMWNIHDSDFEHYDNIWKDHDEKHSRLAFVHHSTGPYTEITSTSTNYNYKDYIEELIYEDFRGLGVDTIDAYEEPRLEVMGCYLPEGRMIPMCGRTPFESEPGE